MIDFGEFVFASPPRTGTTWFIHACSMMGLGDTSKTYAHIPFSPSEKLSVSLVRHPYDWLVSYYLELKGGAIGVPAVDAFCKLARSCQDADSFVSRCATSNPGLVGEMFDSYNATTIMRLEDFPWAPIEFFNSIGVKKNLVSELNELPAVNARKGIPHVADKRLRRRLVWAERDFCDAYEYI